MAHLRSRLRSRLLLCLWLLFSLLFSLLRLRLRELLCERSSRSRSRSRERDRAMVRLCSPTLEAFNPDTERSTAQAQNLPRDKPCFFFTIQSQTASSNRSVSNCSRLR